MKKNVDYFEYPTKVDMSLHQETKPNYKSLKNSVHILWIISNPTQ